MSFVAYPIKVYPIFKEKIWGGRKLKEFFKIPKSHKIGEVWFFADQELDCSIISNGCYKGIKLNQMMKNYSEKLLGKEISKKYKNRFPLLFKFIDSEDKLSIQVHPDDSYAKKNNLPSGKSEAWYIVSADKNSFVLLGLKKRIKKNIIKKLILSGQIVTNLKKYKTRVSDCYYIKGGTIHSIGPSNIIFEIQQNTDITYRIYDWGRQNLEISRTLDLENGIKAIKINNKPIIKRKIKNEILKNTIVNRRNLLKTREFFIYELIMEKGDKYWYNCITPVVISFFNGTGDIIWKCGKEKVKKGDVVLIPFVLKSFILRANDSLKCLFTEIR
ncbi:MAG: class I mannose-6-phosphate isomerase [Candidatus Goldbacteria bacterium]|nr:class I mannose-6-phosphate isomerase [Candidatus Goldiibacteriota bacterium]